MGLPELWGMDKGRGIWGFPRGARPPFLPVAPLSFWLSTGAGGGEDGQESNPFGNKILVRPFFVLNSEKDGFLWAGGEQGLALDWAQVGFPDRAQLRGRAPGQGVRLGDALPLFSFFFPIFIAPQLHLGAGFGWFWGRAHPQLAEPERCPRESL